MGIYIIEVDKSEIVECWNEQAVKELGYQEYALKKCPEIKVKIYNPSGDLISREALKKEFGYTDEWYKGRSICNIIDNAMSMHYTFLPQYQADLQGAYDCGYEKGKQERPKNKWEFKKGNGYAKCPVCYHLTTCWSEEELKDYRYCYYCGTKLEGGAE